MEWVGIADAMATRKHSSRMRTDCDSATFSPVGGVGGYTLPPAYPTSLHTLTTRISYPLKGIWYQGYLTTTHWKGQ